MKKLTLLCLLVLTALPVFASDIKSGSDLIAAMHKKYDGKWYKTLTFVQKTINYKADGTSESSIWYEALNAPGKLRIDFDPVDKGNGILFADGTLYSFKDGKLAGKRPFVHPLLVLGFDVYMQPVETTVAQLKGMNIDMSVVHQDQWQGKAVYVVGAKQGDLKVPQFWVDKKDLLFVRMIDLTGKDKKNIAETQFNKYVKVKGGGWVSAEVQFFMDGKPRTTEQYSDIQTGMKLDAELWDPEKWMAVDKSYFKKK
jgi:outer membrane lipoprotein-sorting protein